MRQASRMRFDQRRCVRSFRVSSAKSSRRRIADLRVRVIRAVIPASTSNSASAPVTAIETLEFISTAKKQMDASD